MQKGWDQNEAIVCPRPTQEKALRSPETGPGPAGGSAVHLRAVCPDHSPRLGIHRRHRAAAARLQRGAGPEDGVAHV